MTAAIEPAGKVFVLAPDSSGSSVLATNGHHGPLALPFNVVAGELTTPTVVAAVEACVGARAPVLRIDTYFRDDDGADAHVALVEIEPMEAPAPEGLTFADLTPQTIASMEPALLREPLAGWLERQRTGPSPGQAPWSQPGWFARASAWMVEEMARVGAPAKDPPRLHHMWLQSAILRADSAHDAHFLKCSAPVFRAEAVLTAALAAVTSDLVTPVVSVEPAEGWLLMRDHGSQLVGQMPVADWVRGLEAYGDLQRAWSERGSTLIEIGVPIRSLGALADAVPGMADHPLTSPHLTDADRAAWHAATPSLIAACRRLDALGPPATLVHGDLHPWNIVVQDGRYRVIDWPGAALGHPFVDLALYLFQMDDHDTRRHLRDAYLIGWSGVIDGAALAEAGELALTVGCLDQALLARNFRAALEPADPRQMNPFDAQMLRRALAVLTAGIDYVKPKPARPAP